jgi:two-component system cell cycle sensor histidine kinase/response regulator CckA
MKLSRLLPKKFSVRLIVMTLIAGLLPVMIFSLLMNLFADRFPAETNRAIQQGQEEQWQRSEAVLRQIAENFVRHKALDVALQLELYLKAHPDMTIEELQGDPEFREIAVQPIGSGYTAVQDSDTAVNRFHKNPKIENLDLHSLADKLPEFWAIMDASLHGRHSRGYYRWKDPDGEIRDKFMYIAPLGQKTADGVRFGVAATTYIDEFTRSIQAAQDVSYGTTRYLMGIVNRLTESFRTMGFEFMGLGIVLVLGLAYWMGTYFSRAVTQLREATRAINQGNFNIRVKTPMSGDVGELVKDFNEMVAQLATTTVKKEELEASEEKYRTILESIEEGYYEVDMAGNVIFANSPMYRIIGYSRDELIGMNNRQLMDEETAKKVYQVFNRVYRTGIPSRLLDWELIPKDRSKRYVEVSVSLIKDSEGNPTGFRGILRDISDRKLMEENLKNEKERFESLASDAPFGMSIINPDGTYEYINPEFIVMFGYTLKDIQTGKTWFELAFPDPEYRKEVTSTWLSDLREAKPGALRPREFKVSCKDGSIKDIYFRAVMLKNNNQLVTYEDVTETRKLESQLRHVTKMEAIGTLAGGIAHDFNNLLMAIQGNASLMALDIDRSHPFYERIKNIQQYVQSGADLTKQLLGFARGGKYEVKATDLNKLIEKSSEMFGRTKKEITINLECQEDIWVVEADQGQIEQVLLNLYVNSWQAMPGGGSLYIKTENVTLDRNNMKPYYLDPGNYVKISVTDTGIGMDESTRKRIFDPFFTTKEMGRGTGLGLASVYGIIKNHGGYIDVYSVKGKGTTIELYLPATGENIKELHAKQDAQDEIVRGTETILLVDDEDMIIEVGKEILKTIGYKVLLARSGREAVEIVSKASKGKGIPPIDLVILDMIMPVMGGGDTYDRLKEINPNIKVLLSSGYSIDGDATRILERGCNGFIQKPFNPKQLSQKIRGILTDSQKVL